MARSSVSAIRRSVVCLAVLAVPVLVVIRPAQAQWTTDGVALCAAANDQVLPTLVPDGAGGAIVAWRDQRGGDIDIYAQRVDAAGVPQWTPDGVAITTAAGDQTRQTLVSDGAGGAIITWREERDGVFDIYAQRVSAAGTIQWAANGVAVCAAANSQDVPTIVSDGAGGAIVAWDDFRSGTTWDIYAQRVNAAGVAQWTLDGVTLSMAANDKTSLEIESDGAAGAIVIWDDFRHGLGNSDIYAQRVNAAGTMQWAANGVAVCAATNSQQSPTIVSDGAGGAIVAWADFRSGTSDDPMPSGWTRRVCPSGPWTAWR